MVNTTSNVNTILYRKFENNNFKVLMKSKLALFSLLAHITSRVVNN